jgi:UDP-glucuronate 4-epimerase
VEQKDYYNRILITGVAGFIGYHLAKKIKGEIIGIDNLNDYYSVSLKKQRLKDLQMLKNFNFFKVDISDKETLNAIFKIYRPELVINLAGQAGVRYSNENPTAYIKTNLEGFFNVIECCKKYNVSHLVYASSSSVYGNAERPCKETDTLSPQSLYAVTKAFNEQLANTYNLNTTGLRFFTVYCESGRPDMFISKLINADQITLFGNGELKRDFTYIDDIIDGIIKATKPTKEKHRIYNLGSSNQVTINEVVDIVEELTGKKIKRIYKEKPQEDVQMTFADISKAKKELNWTPKITIKEGLKRIIYGKL